MSLLKRHTGRRRHVGRRVAGVAVGVALLVLGLEAPAFAQTTITGFSPVSGPPGCVVVISGTNFNNPTVTDVDFNGTDAVFEIISPTEIWAEVPAGATNGPINVTNPLETVSSAVGFTVTGGAGDCAPTITSFTPTCGPAGTDVTITGTNLLQSPTAGGNVRFAPYAANATPTAADVSPTEISVNVPAGAQDGPIQVRIPGVGNVNSTGTFDVGSCITEISPTSGAVGDTVTITGVGFENATAVTFAGEPAEHKCRRSSRSPRTPRPRTQLPPPFRSARSPVRSPLLLLGARWPRPRSRSAPLRRPPTTRGP